MEKLPSLQTATIYRDIALCMESAYSSHGSDNCDICWGSIQRDLLDDKLMLTWSSAAYDLSHYNELKDEDYRIDLIGSKDSGNILVYYYYNINQGQLWVDGCHFYRYRIPTSYENFWEFESIDFIQCNSFVTKFQEYEHEISMWIVLHRIDCK